MTGMVSRSSNLSVGGSSDRCSQLSSRESRRQAIARTFLTAVVDPKDGEVVSTRVSQSSLHRIADVRSELRVREGETRLSWIAALDRAGHRQGSALSRRSSRFTSGYARRPSMPSCGPQSHLTSATLVSRCRGQSGTSVRLTRGPSSWRATTSRRRPMRSAPQSGAH